VIKNAVVPANIMYGIKGQNLCVFAWNLMQRENTQCITKLANIGKKRNSHDIRRIKDDTSIKM